MSAGKDEAFLAEDMAGLRQLLKLTLKYEPPERPTAEEVLQLGWLRKLVEKLNEQQLGGIEQGLESI